MTPNAPATPEQTPELLPCPFCGGEGIPMQRTCNPQDRYNPADRAFPVVRCKECHAQASGGNWQALETAIEAWNRRALLSSPATGGADKSWRPISEAPEGREVAVFWDDHGHENYAFDFKQDGEWLSHQSSYESYSAAGKPAGIAFTGPNETAPYTHFMDICTNPNTTPRPAIVPTGGATQGAGAIEKRLRECLKQNDFAILERFNQGVKFHIEMGRLPKTDNPLISPVDSLRLDITSGNSEWFVPEIMAMLAAHPAPVYSGMSEAEKEDLDWIEGEGKSSMNLPGWRAAAKTMAAAVTRLSAENERLKGGAK